MCLFRALFLYHGVLICSPDIWNTNVFLNEEQKSQDVLVLCEISPHQSKHLEVAGCMFSSEKNLTQSRHSLTVMATCVRVSDHSYSALEQAVLFWATASSRLHSPFGSSSFCTRESSACGAGGFLGGREKLLMLQMSLEKEWKKF